MKNEIHFKEKQNELIAYLREKAIKNSISFEMLAEITGFKPKTIKLMFEGIIPPRLHDFIALANALNCYLFVIDKDDNDDLVELMRNRWGVVGSN